jgi:hypothetical protein
MRAPLMLCWISLAGCSQPEVVRVEVPRVIDVPAPLLMPVSRPVLRGDTVGDVGEFIAAQDLALTEANGRISATCRIISKHNEEAGAVQAECEGRTPQ